MLSRSKVVIFLCRFFWIGVFLFVWSPSVFAGVGAYVGTGIPHVARLGLTYQFSSSYGLDGFYGTGNLARTCTDLTFKTSLLSLNYHPFAGPFYLGIGAGTQKMTVTNTYTVTNQKFTIDVDGTIALARLGWKWGLEDRGFWWGLDLTAITSIQNKKTPDAVGVPTTSQDYINSMDDAEQVGDRGYRSVGIILGWSF